MKKYLSILLILYYSSYFSQIEYGIDIIKTLSSEEYKGRGYVDKGLNITSTFIQGEFIKNGLKSFNNSYFQKYSHPVNVFPSKMSISLNNNYLIPGKDYVIDPSSKSIKGKYKVIKIDTSNYFTKTKENINNKKIIFCITDTFSNKENQIAINKAIDYVSSQFNLIIEKKSKTNWWTSTYQSSSTIIYTNNVFFGIDDELKIHIKSKFIKNYISQNIIGYIEGTEKNNNYLVFTAHYDHLGKMGKNTTFYGANDNASGIAMMLSLAKYYSKNPPKQSIVFIAFGSEEIGLLGSKYYVQNPIFDLDKIDFLINVDLVGTGIDGIQIVNSTIHTKEFNLLKDINDKNKLLKELKTRGKARNSDHYYFEEAGVKTFFIYTLGGVSFYHDIFDRFDTLPLSEFDDLQTLIIKFYDKLMNEQSINN